VFTSNAFRDHGSAALYFMLADMHARFSYLQQGLATILPSWVLKMVISAGYHNRHTGVILVIVLGWWVPVSLPLQRTRGARKDRVDSRGPSTPDEQ